MRTGLSIPSTVDVDRDTLCEWIRRVDRGPFSRLATGERIAAPTLDLLTTLSAAAVLTERVPSGRSLFELYREARADGSG